MFSGMNYVYEVYKEQSFSKAAENLYISQPALSSMIKKIETKIGMPLFDRSTENRPSVRGRDLSLFILHFSTHH